MIARDGVQPVLWVRPRSQRGVVAEHLQHVGGSFEAAGWSVVTADHLEPPTRAALAVMDDAWVEPLPLLARALAAVPVTGPPVWRVPRVWGLAGKQGWHEKTPPATMSDYERRSVLRRGRHVVSIEKDPWCGFAVAAPGQAEDLLSIGWPPNRAALVSTTRLYRYSDPSAHDRRELVRFVPASARRVVDVGCGSGMFGALLREAGKTVIGVEPDWELARLARAKLTVVLPLLGEQGFAAIRPPVDCVVLADVLEHTAAPQRLLRMAGAAVGPSGRLVVSFPNAAWAPVVRGLASGRWDPTLAGVQARDHLFYTTPRSFAILAAECGLAVETLQPLGAVASFRDRLWAWAVALAAGGTPAEMAAPQWVAVLGPR